MAVDYRKLFIRVIFDDPEEQYQTETELRKALMEHLEKFPGVSGALIEMQQGGR